MKNVFKKIIAVVMATVMFVLSAVTVVANAVDTSKKCPTVYVPGFMASEILADKDNPESEAIWPPSSDSIVNAIKQSVPALLEFAALKDWDKFADQLIVIANELFLPAENDENGEPVDNSGTYFVYPPAKYINEDSSVTFRYDWRKDPIEIAGELNDFIEYVKKASKCDQVSIECHSLGSVITTSYATIYGDKSLKTVVYNAPALFGETYNSELMRGQLVLNAEAINEYLEYAFDTNEYSDLINLAFDTLEDAGILDIICSMGNTLLEEIGTKVSAQSVVPLFARWTTIWAMVPDEYIDDAMEYVFTDLKEYYDDDYTELIKKIENYNNTVRCKKVETLNKLNDDANLYVITRYGYSSLPLTPSSKSLSDGVVDAKYASFGATTANYGEQLSEDYLATANSKYISPDKSIDASTCLFPEQTWFIRDITHSYNSDALDEMIKTFIDYEGQGTISTFSQYPQFLKFDIETDTILADTTAPQTLSFFDKIVNALEDLIKLIKYVFSLINK